MATAIQREIFPWGVKLSVRPFARLKAELAPLAINSEVSRPRERGTPQVKINFSTIPSTFSLRLTEGQLWHEAFGALIEETRNAVASMKAEKPKRATSAKLARGKRRS